MDTKEDQNEEDDNNVEIATDDQPDVNTNNTPSNTSSGLQQIDDNDNSDLPLPMGMAEVISNRAEPPKQIAKVEQIDNDCPEPPAAVGSNTRCRSSSNYQQGYSIYIKQLSTVNEQSSSPTPFNSRCNCKEGKRFNVT